MAHGSIFAAPPAGGGAFDGRPSRAVAQCRRISLQLRLLARARSGGAPERSAHRRLRAHSAVTDKRTAAPSKAAAAATSGKRAHPRPSCPRERSDADRAPRHASRHRGTSVPLGHQIGRSRGVRPRSKRPSAAMTRPRFCASCARAAAHGARVRGESHHRAEENGRAAPPSPPPRRGLRHPRS